MLKLVYVNKQMLMSYLYVFCLKLFCLFSLDTSCSLFFNLDGFVLLHFSGNPWRPQSCWYVGREGVRGGIEMV